MRRDWGCITNEGKGVWRIRWWASTATGYRRCSETIRGTRRMAGDRLAELRLMHGHDAPCPTVGDCWRNWFLPDRERMVEQGDLAPLTLDQHKSTWRRHVEPRWENVACDSVRPLDVQQWLLELKRSAAEASLHLLRQVLDYATRYGHLETNPLALRYMLPSSSTVEHREDGVWTIDELGDVWAACWGEWYEAAFLLASFGGCRVGESLGAKAADIRTEVVDGVLVALVRICRQIDSRAREAERTKNRWSTRTVLLAGKPAERLAHLVEGRDKNEYVSHPAGRSFGTQRELRLAFAERLQERDAAVHLFKNLRKTWQTNARWVLQLPPWIVEPMMGHAGKGVTGHYYDKPSDHELAAALVAAWKTNPFGDRYEWLAKVE